jgi:hypothetical protein
MKLLLPAAGLGLLTMLAIQAQGVFIPVNATTLIGSNWKNRDSDYSMSLTLSASSFIFDTNQTGSLRIPYRQLTNRLVLLGKDTVCLYMRNGNVLRISPTSRKLTRSESIDLQYGTDFFRQ